MRARILSWLVIPVVLGLCSSPSSGRGPDETNLGWSWDQVAFQVTEDGRTECAVRGAALRPGLPGEPALPARLVRMEAPEGSSPSRYEIVGEIASTRPLPGPLAAVLRDAPIEAGGPTSVDPAEYAYAAPRWPAERVRFLGISLGRGRSWAQFAVYPLVLEDGDAVSLLEQGTLVVRWQEDAAAPRPLKCLRTEGAGDLLIPPLESVPPVSSRKTLATAPRPSLASDPVEYVVLTSKTLLVENSKLNLLVNWKNQSGTPTAVRTVEWVDSTYVEGVDQAERIRNFLIEAYQYWGARWLLIVGGPTEVPVRTLRSYTWGCPVGLGIISDIYYAGLDGNWNRDGDDLFGEGIKAECPPNPIGDGADFDPELYVGRIPASTPAQVATFVDKYLTYVKTPVLDGYLDKMLFLGEVLFDSDWTRTQLTRVPPCLICSENRPQCSPCVRLDGARDCVSAVSIIEEAEDLNPQIIEMYEWHEYWQQPPRNRVNAVLELQPNVITQLNQGVGFIHHVGHGSWDRMSIGTKTGADGSGRYLVGDARQMSNGQRLSVLYSINCNSAAFDLDCLAEAFLFASGGGVVSYIGSTNLDFPAAATAFQNSTYSKLFLDNRAGSLGEAFFDAITEQLSFWGDREGYSRFLAFSLALLGDPQMLPWLETPKELTIQAPTSMTLGDSTITVRVQRDGVYLREARVSAYKTGDTWGSAMTDNQGTAVVPFRPGSLGTFNVTVTERSAVPYVQADIPVQAAAGRAALALTELTVDDLTAAGPPQVQGNNDGRLDFGETVKLNVKIKNSGQATSSALTLTLRIEPSEVNPWIEILDGTEELAGGITPGATAQAQGAFRIRVTPGAPSTVLQNGDRLPCRAVVEISQASPARTSTFTEPLPAYRPLFDLEQGVLAEVSGDGNGLPDTGETMSWRPVLRNYGAGSAANLTGILTALSGATIVSGTDSYPLSQAIEGQTSTTVGGAQYRFQVTNAQTLRLQFEVKSAFNASFSFLVREVEFEMPAPPSFPTDRPPQATKDAIMLTWSATPDPDIEGYVLERSATETGAYARVHDRFLRGMEYFRDEGLGGLTRYFYRVAAIDSSGNWSAYSEPVGATTNPASLSGWPISVSGDPNWGCPTIENLDATDHYEIFVGADRVYGLRDNGTEIIDGDGVPSTFGVWSETPAFIWSKPAIADITGDGNVEVVVTARYRSETDKTPYVFVWNREGTRLWSRAAGTNNYLMASPLLADIAGDLKPEVIVQNRGFLYAWNGDGSPVITGNADGKLAYLGGGNPADPASWPYTYGSPAAANLDPQFDPKDEIIVQLETSGTGAASILAVVRGDGTILATAPLEQGLTGDEARSNSSPSVADVDGDDAYDIFVATRNYLWSFKYEPSPPRSLVLRTGWPYQIDKLPTNWTEPTPAIGDIDGDGQKDIVLGSGRGKLVAVNANSAAALPGFPRQIADADEKVGSAILVNLDADALPEIVVGDNQGIVHAINGDAQGAPVAGFPYVMGGRIQHGLTCWDIDRNANPNLVVQAEFLASIAILEISDVIFPLDLPTAMRLNPWTSFRHDARNTGRIDADVITPVVTIEVEARAEVGAAVLTWRTPVEPAVFRVERQGPLGEWEIRGEGDPSLFLEGSWYTFRDPASPGKHLYRVTGFDAYGREVFRSGGISLTIDPFRLRIAAAVPNPTGGVTNIRYETPGGQVRLDILDLTGRRIRTLIDNPVEAGLSDASWDGRDESGHAVRSGVYLAHLRNAMGSQSMKITLLR